MKKLGLGVVLSVMVVLVSACGGNKTLECSIEKEENGIVSSQVYTLKFNKSNKFESAKLKQEMKLNKDNLDNLSTYKKTVENTFNSSTYKELNPKVSDNNKDTITVTLDFDSDDANKISSNADTSKVSYKDMKKKLEENGYVCK